jgi:ZIP family zinc transporter
MNEFLSVLAIALPAAGLTTLGAPLAERVAVSQRVLSAALQFAAGVLTALVALTLMPPAVRGGEPLVIALAFFLGGAVFVVFDTISARKRAERPSSSGAATSSLGLYVGILADMFIDGAVIGIGASLTLSGGLLLALGITVSTFPLAFVTTTLAKNQGVPAEQRRLLATLYFVCLLAGAVLSYTLLRNQPEALRLAIIAFAAGFLLTTVTQSLIPEANREGEPTFAAVLFTGGMSLYALMSLLAR